MRTSRSVGYALVALGFISQHQKAGNVVSQNIAKKYGIPLEYLLKIMQNLVKVGILRSKRGPRGGFVLNKSLDQISMLQVVEAVDGPMGVSLGFEDLKIKNNFVARAQKSFETAMKGASDILGKTKISALTQ